MIKHDLEKDKNLKALCDALLLLKDPKEERAFLIDLCTPAELRAISERWHVARLLDTGEHSYRDIREITGVSTTTVGRVARFMSEEPYQGYAVVLDRQKEQEQ